MRGSTQGDHTTTKIQQSTFPFSSFLFFPSWMFYEMKYYLKSIQELFLPGPGPGGLWWSGMPPGTGGPLRSGKYPLLLSSFHPTQTWTFSFFSTLYHGLSSPVLTGDGPGCQFFAWNFSEFSSMAEVAASLDLRFSIFLFKVLTESMVFLALRTGVCDAPRQG